MIVKEYGSKYDDLSSGELTHREKKLNAVKEMVEFLETHPNVPLPAFYGFSVSNYDVVVFDDDGQLVDDVPQDKILATVTKELSRNGKVKKIANNYSFGVERKFGDEWDGITYSYTTSRDEVCKKVATGVKVTKVERKLVQEAVYEDVEVEEDETVWECPPLLAKLNNTPDA